MHKEDACSTFISSLRKYLKPPHSELVQLKLNIESSVGESTPTEVEIGTPTYRSGSLGIDKCCYQDQLVDRPAFSLTEICIKQLIHGLGCPPCWNRNKADILGSIRECLCYFIIANLKPSTVASILH